MAVTLPFLLLLLDYWPLGRLQRKDRERGREGEGETTERRFAAESPPLPLSPSPHLVWRVIWEKVPMLAIACLFCLVNVHGQGHALDINESYSFGWRMGNALISYVAYLGQSVCPAGLAPIYPRRPSFLSPWQIGGAILVLAAITAATSACWRKRPWLLVGWLWYAGMLVPVIGLVQFGAQAEADRYTYLPQIGLTLAVVWTASELWWGGKGKGEGGRVSDQWRDSPPRRGDAESAPSPGLCAPAVSDLPRLMPHPSSFSSFFRQTGAAAAASLLAVLVVSAWRQNVVLARQRDALDPHAGLHFAKCSGPLQPRPRFGWQPAN